MAETPTADEPIGDLPGPAAGPPRRTIVLLAVVLGALLAVAATCALMSGEDEPEGPTIVGTWRDTWQVERTGDQAYTGIGLTDAIEPDSGCPYRAGETEWRITGSAPRYEGEERWVKGSNGQNCEYTFAEATFTLLEDGQVVEVCSTDPFQPAPELCRKLPRTDGSPTG